MYQRKTEKGFGDGDGGWGMGDLYITTEYIHDIEKWFCACFALYFT